MPSASGTSTISAASRVIASGGAKRYRPSADARSRRCSGSTAIAITTAQASAGRKPEAIHSPSSSRHDANTTRATRWLFSARSGDVMDAA
ncbi:MAG: hypothetical protein WDN44_10065 [Sphingomonas sp.]